jgi:hypothetical protein
MTVGTVIVLILGALGAIAASFWAAFREYPQTRERREREAEFAARLRGDGQVAIGHLGASMHRPR